MTSIIHQSGSDTLGDFTFYISLSLSLFAQSKDKSEPQVLVSVRSSD